MAFPVGALPSPGEVQDFSKVSSPGRSIVFTSGGSDLDLTDPANAMRPCATEFWCTTAGNLIARLAGDTADRTYAVTLGMVSLKGLFVVARSTSTANGIFRQ